MLRSWLGKRPKVSANGIKLLSRSQDIQRKMRQYEDMAQEITTYCGDLTGKTILEVGSGAREECLSKYLNDQYDLEYIVALDPAARTPNKVNETFEIKRGDICEINLDDNTFDVIVSIAAFEHIPDFEKALREMFRLLKPGGVLYTKFGPIWSGPWGHHLWVQCEDHLYNYNNTHLPAYCHLLMDETELVEICTQKMGIPGTAAEKICDFVFNSKDQNRLFFSDYERIFYNSDFEVLFLYGSNQFPLKEGYVPTDYRELMVDLVTKFPEKSGWTYNAIYCLLRKLHDK